MSERRMFAKTIIDSDAFLDMPLSTQALYFHLSMRADDEGFINNPKKIQRMIGASDDDLKVLVAKNFVIPFESGIVVIKHWRIHNYIRGDRLHETKFTEEKSLLEVKENGAYTLCLSSDRPMSDNRYTEDSIGKVRIGKDNINNIIATPEKEIFITLTLNDKSEYGVSVDDVEDYKELYPAVDVEQQLRNMKGWCDANPTKRKTKSGIKRFINSWLSKEQDRPTQKAENKSGYDLYRQTKSAGYDFEALERELRG